jgi:transposase
MQIRLHLRLIRVLEVVVDTVSEVVVAVTSTRSWSRCPHCGFRCRRVHDSRLRRVRDLPISGRAVTLIWHRRRFSCDNCGERHVEDHDAFEGRLSRRMARAVVARTSREPRSWHSYRRHTRRGNNHVTVLYAHYREQP